MKSKLPELYKALESDIYKKFRSELNKFTSTNLINLASINAEKKFALSISTYYCDPRDMLKYKMLMRGSAYIIRRNSGSNFPFQYHIITCRHNIAPWIYPKYYPDDFLRSVDEKNVCHTIETRGLDGQWITMNLLYPIIYHHLELDIAVLHLIDEDKSIESLLKANMQICENATTEEIKQRQDNLEFYGHNVIHSENSSESDFLVPYPLDTTGEIQHITKTQFFASTKLLLSQGMCGGPVLVDRLDETSPGSFEVCKVSAGFTEGIVPLDSQHLPLRGCAAIIKSDDVKSFLRDIESGAVESVAGGQLMEELYPAGGRHEIPVEWDDIFTPSSPTKI